jgi:hypothetical protein
MIAGRRNWRLVQIVNVVPAHSGQAPQQSVAGTCWVDIQPMSLERLPDVISSTPGLPSGPVIYNWFMIFTIGRVPPVINRTDILRDLNNTNPVTNQPFDYHVQNSQNWGDHLEMYAQAQASGATHES